MDWKLDIHYSHGRQEIFHGRIALLNLLGSIAFGVSAVAAFIQPLTGHPIEYNTG